MFVSRRRRKVEVEKKCDTSKSIRNNIREEKQTSKPDQKETAGIQLIRCSKHNTNLKFFFSHLYLFTANTHSHAAHLATTTINEWLVLKSGIRRGLLGWLLWNCFFFVVVGGGCCRGGRHVVAENMFSNLELLISKYKKNLAKRHLTKYWILKYHFLHLLAKNYTKCFVLLKCKKETKYFVYL